MNFSIKAATLAVVSSLVLSACGGESEAASGAVSASNLTDPEAIAEALGNLPKPQPGEYKIEAEVVEFAMPGASEEESNALRGLVEMGAMSGITFCMNEEMAQQGHEEYLEQLQGMNENCNYDSLSIDGDKIDAKLTCGFDGASSTIEFNGTISETGSNMTVSMDMQEPITGKGIQMVMRNTTERLGECTSDSINFDFSSSAQ